MTDLPAHRATERVADWFGASIRRTWWAAFALLLALGGAWTLANPLYSGPDGQMCRATSARPNASQPATRKVRRAWVGMRAPVSRRRMVHLIRRQAGRRYDGNGRQIPEADCQAELIALG